MNEKLATRAEVNSAMEALTAQVLGAPDERLVACYRPSTTGVHFGPEPEDARQALLTYGIDVLDALERGLDDLTRETEDGVLAGTFHYVGSVGYLNWLIGFGGGFYAEGAISSKERDYVVAQPCISILRNIDHAPILFNRIRMPYGFSKVESVSVNEAEQVTVEPGAMLNVNGFTEIVWPQSTGQFFLRIQSLQLGAYEHVFDHATGERIGSFSPDIRVSIIEKTFCAFSRSPPVTRASPLHSLRQTIRFVSCAGRRSTTTGALATLNCPTT